MGINILGGFGMKKSMALLLSAMLMVCMAASCTTKNNGAGSANTGDASGNLITIGFSQVGTESDWRLANTKSMRETFTEANGFKLVLKEAQQKLDNQLSAIREFIALKVNYIVVAPTSETGWDEVLSEAKAAGIPVIIVDRMINVADDSLYTCWVGSDFRNEGDTAVKWMEKIFKDASDVKIVHLQGSLGSSAQIGRTDGLEDGVKRNAGWEIIYQVTGDFTQVKGKEVMEYVLKQFSHIDVVYCENDNMAFGATEAMDNAGVKYGVGGGITVISFDATNAGLTATLAGKINYNVECNPLHGPRVLSIIRQLENGDKPDKRVYVEELAFDATVITQADIDARAY
jgi:simple sugar transport system substrate-binding protein